MSSITEISLQNNSIPTEIPKKLSYWTDAKIQKIALYTLAFLALAAAAASVASPLIGFIAIPWVIYLSIPLSLGAIGIAYCAYQIKDYQNPEILRGYKEEARTMNFKELYNAHGIRNIIRYEILQPEELKKKFVNQIQEMNFECVLKHFNWNDLIEHQIASPAHVQLLQDLNAKAERSKAQCWLEIRQSNHLHSGRSEKLRQKVRDAKLIADGIAVGTAERGNEGNAYFKANLVTTPLAYIGDAIVNEAGRDEQMLYDAEITAARRKCNDRLNQLQQEYREFLKSVN